MIPPVSQPSSQPSPSPQHAPFSGRATSAVIGRGIVLMQINAEGISKAKTEIITHLATENGATVILLQETHATKPNVLNIPGYNLAAHTISGVHGIATFVLSSAK